MFLAANLKRTYCAGNFNAVKTKICLNNPQLILLHSFKHFLLFQIISLCLPATDHKQINIKKYA